MVQADIVERSATLSDASAHVRTCEESSCVVETRSFLLLRHASRADCLVLIIVMRVIAAANLRRRRGSGPTYQAQVESNGPQNGPSVGCRTTKRFYGHPVVPLGI